MSTKSRVRETVPGLSVTWPSSRGTRRRNSPSPSDPPTRPKRLRNEPDQRPDVHSARPPPGRFVAPPRLAAYQLRSGGFERDSARRLSTGRCRPRCFRPAFCSQHRSGRPLAPQIVYRICSPWHNGFAERLIGSIRRECVDHIIVLAEGHLRRILESCARFYNESGRIGHWTKMHRQIQRTGCIKLHAILGGLHNHCA